MTFTAPLSTYRLLPLPALEPEVRRQTRQDSRHAKVKVKAQPATHPSLFRSAVGTYLHLLADKKSSSLPEDINIRLPVHNIQTGALILILILP